MSGERRARTVLEQRIWERKETLEEFVAFVERFAREHHEPGTLSLRHLARLVAGRTDHGQPLGRPRPATARLFERIFDEPIDSLLRAPAVRTGDIDEEANLRERLRAARRVDRSTVVALTNQLNATRRLDRQLGAGAAQSDVLVKVGQVAGLLECSLSPHARTGLSCLLADLEALAGWQYLDAGDLRQAWRHYARGRSIAAEAAPAYAAHTAAGLSFVLLDLGDTAAACELLAETRRTVDRQIDPTFRAWLAAAHGEVLAADGQRSATLHAFDEAGTWLPRESAADEGPYIVLDPVHLDRWRGHALAKLGEPEAIRVLESTLDRLDPTFARAETALRVDLASAYVSIGELDQARCCAHAARLLAIEVGSKRQQRRLAGLQA